MSTFPFRPNFILSTQEISQEIQYHNKVFDYKNIVGEQALQITFTSTL